MRTIFFALALLMATYAVQAQTNLDSLYAVWEDETQPDSSRAKAYFNYIYDGFIYSDPDTASILADDLMAFGKNKEYPKAQVWGLDIKGISNAIRGDNSKALDYYTQSLKIKEQMGDQKGMAITLHNIGIVYANQGNYPKALDYFNQCLKVSEQLGYKKEISNALNGIGIIYYYQGDYPKTLDYYNQGLKLSEQLGDQQQIANTLNNIGIIYREQGDYLKALDYYTQSLKYFEQLGDQKGIANTLGNIGNIYGDLGDHPKALDYYNQSLKIREHLGDQKGISASFNNIGIAYHDQGNYPKALDYYTQALKIKEQMGDQKGMANTLGNIGDLYNEQGDHPKALDVCKRAYDLALSIGVLDEQKQACQCLYDSYKAMGKGNEALVYLEKMRVVEDSLKSEETSKQLQQMEFQKAMLQDSITKAEEARLVQEAHEEEVRQKNRTRNMLLGGGLFVLLLAGGIFSRLQYVRKSKAVLQVEKDRSENLLLNILPADIASELKEKGHASARDFDLVSILFTDFKAFTATSAKLSAQELVTEINVCFEAFDGFMDKYGIEKIKTIGDAYMAAGGLPVPTEDSVKNTVLAALEMQAFISKRKAELEAMNKPAFEMRVGIHTGPVVAGIVGVKKFQYDIWGDTVNTANRMETNGEVGKVNVSHATYKLLKDDPDFRFESRGKIEAKGKGEIEMYFVSKA